MHSGKIAAATIRSVDQSVSFQSSLWHSLDHRHVIGTQDPSKAGGLSHRLANIPLTLCQRHNVNVKSSMRPVPLASSHESPHRLSAILLIFLLIARVIFAARPTPDGIGGSNINESLIANSSVYSQIAPASDTANPRNNITCVGQFPDLRLPLLQDGFDPNTASMQKLCAKTNYGGGAPGEHAGGYCWTRPGTFSYNHNNTETTGDVGFDLSRAAHASTQLQNPRFLLACFYRCFCNYGLDNPSNQPKSKYAFFRTSMVRSLFSYELQLDLDNDFTTPRWLKSGKQGARRVKSIRVPERAELAQTEKPSGRLGREYITLDPGNEIECRGNLPSFVLPAPYTISDFGSLQELCATQLNGGNM